MDAMKSDFYVTLPSNASMEYFPENTQASFRTKLSSPLSLNESWEVALSEIIIPRNWFNISDHNNEYSLSFQEEQEQEIDIKPSVLRFDYDPSDNIYELFDILNQNLEEKFKASVLKIVLDANKEKVTIEIADGFELTLKKRLSSRLLFILGFNDEDVTISETITHTFREDQLQTIEEQSLFIYDRTPLSINNHILPFTYIQAKEKKILNDEMIAVLSKNVEDLGLKKYVSFKHNAKDNTLVIKVTNRARLEINKQNAPSFLRILHHDEDLLIKDTQTFNVDPALFPEKGNFLTLYVREYPKITTLQKVTNQFRVNGGVYQTARDLFAQFREIRMQQLPNFKVSLHVPDGFELDFARALSDMLGFVETHFTAGHYTSFYPLELNAGISEIFVYSDILSSSHVGDSHVPLLRIIPCLNEKGEQIVKEYDKPVYFPLKKNIF